MDDLTIDLDSTITMTTKNLSLNIMSPELIYYYEKDQMEAVTIDVLMMSSSSSIYRSKTGASGVSLQIS